MRPQNGLRLTLSSKPHGINAGLYHVPKWELRRTETEVEEEPNRTDGLILISNEV